MEEKRVFVLATGPGEKHSKSRPFHTLTEAREFLRERNEETGAIRIEIYVAAAEQLDEVLT